MSFTQNRSSVTNTKKLALMAILTAVMIVLGLWNIPMPAGLSITFNMIPVAIAAIAMGVSGGIAMGAVFGLISFLQCFGVCGSSPMGIALVSEAPVWMSFVQRFVSRVLMGLLVALIDGSVKKHVNTGVRGAVTGFSAAFLNTLLFMSLLVLLFGQTEYMQGKMAGRAFLTYLVASVGVNGLVEMAVAAFLTSAVAAALKKARMI
ncbi:MAG: ECF transporter S component [Clostridia bacterium]|nr:ECF transporter S component [Clostridia bacterium]MBR4458754.1 ECF transporter S component [Clostridia bacterium]